MTEQTSENGPGIDAEAERIVNEGADIRERIRRLVLRVFRERRMALSELNDLARQVVDGTAEAMRRANREQGRDALCQVAAGLEDAYAAASQATRLAVEEAATRGQAFAEADLKRAKEDLKSLEGMFFQTLSDTASRFSHEMAEQWRDLAAHTQRTGSHVGQAAEEALGVIRRDPLGFARQSAAASAELTRHSAGMLLQAMAGMLQGAGEALLKDQDKQGLETKEG